MPLPPELTHPNIDIVAVPEPDRIQRGIELAAAWSVYSRAIVAAVPPDPVEAQLALDVLNQVVEQIEDLAGVGSALATMNDIEGRFERVSRARRALLQEIVDNAALAPPPPIGPPPIPENTPPNPAEIVALFPMATEQALLNRVFFPATPLRDELHSVVKELHSKISGMATVRRDGRAKDIFNQAEGTISRTWQYVDKQRATASMTLLQLLDEMGDKNVNPDDHAEYSKPTAEARLVELYLAFNGRKTGSPNEPAQAKLERIETIMGWKINKGADDLQNEGEKPSATRPELFEVLGARNIEREELLTISTCHPEYGTAMRHMLRHLVWVISKQQHTTINYDDLTLAHGRPTIEDYMRKVFRPQLLGQGGFPPITFDGMDPGLVVASEHHVVGQIYAALPLSEREKKVDEAIALTTRLFFMFSLIDVPFGELQAETKTRGHDLTKKGKEITDKDRVLLSRPDTALVHRSQRYDSDTDWSLWWLVLMQTLPNRYGRTNYSNGRIAPGEAARHHEKHHELEEIREKLIDSLGGYFDVDKFTGINGIPPSSLFNPLFPDMLSYLDLAKNETLVIGDDVYGKVGDDVVRLGAVGQAIIINHPDGTIENRVLPSKSQNIASREFYTTAERGWERMLELALGSLPPDLQDHHILEHADGFSTGLIDEIIKVAAGQAKMFPGNHLKLAFSPVFTLYLGRIFMRYRDTGRARKATFDKVVSKIQQAGAGGGGGLASYRAELNQVIENISDGTGGRKMGSMLEYNILGRRSQREKFTREIFIEKGWAVPISTAPGSRLIVGMTPDPVKRAQMIKFLDIVDGKLPLPDPGVTRKGDLMRKKDGK